jgi:cobalt-zinc-cadmium efflux system membrane fusion protein
MNARNTQHPGARIALLLSMLLWSTAGCQRHDANPKEAAARPNAHAHDAEAHGDEPRDEHGHGDQHGESEGVVRLKPEAVTGSEIVTGHAGPRRIEVLVETPGEVRMNAERVVDVRPRFPGVVRTLAKGLGDRVAKDETIATIHSNESMAEYTIASPITGSVVAREASLGLSVDHDDRLYTIADLSTVWVDVSIYPQNAGTVRRGQSVRITSQAGTDLATRGVIRYVGPLLEQDTRVSYARVVLPNRDGRWQPGLYVTAAITVSEANVTVAAPEDAIVRMPEGPAVFRDLGGGSFRAQPVVTGRSDGSFTEIVQGLEPGAAIVVKNAFLLKAELGKAEASHEH